METLETWNQFPWNTNSSARGFVGISVDAEGDFLVGVPQNSQYLYSSKNSGISWDILTSAPILSSGEIWAAVKVSQDSQYIFAYMEYMSACTGYCSASAGSKFVECVGASIVTPLCSIGTIQTSIYMSPNGEYTVYGGNSNYEVFLSTNYLLSFQHYKIPINLIYALTADSNLNTIWFAANDLYKSTDQAQSWTQVVIANLQPNIVVASQTGQYIVVAEAGNAVYFSLDYGSNWGIANSIGFTSFYMMVSDNSGRYWAVISPKVPGTNCSVLLSDSYGTTWYPASLPNSLNYLTVAMTADASFTYASTIPYLEISTSVVVYDDMVPGYPTLNPTAKPTLQPTTGIDSWTTMSNGLPSNANWLSLAMNSTGEQLIASSESNPIYMSYDGGNSWQSTKSGSASWTAVCSDSSGQYLLGARQDTGYIYYSWNRGESWTSSPSSGVNDFDQLVTSQDGQHAYGKLSSGSANYLYGSTDYGKTWDVLYESGLKCDYTAIAVNYNGQYLLAGSVDCGLVISKNYGMSMTILASAPTGQQWTAVATSSDATTFVAGTNTGSIYYSINSGTTWTQASVFTSISAGLNQQLKNHNRIFPVNTVDTWTSFGGSSSLEYLVGTIGFSAYISTDFGKTWSLSSLPDGDQAYGSVASNSDGTEYLMTSSAGTILLGTMNYPTNQPSANPTDVENSNNANSFGTNGIIGVSIGGSILFLILIGFCWLKFWKVKARNGSGSDAKTTHPLKPDVIINPIAENNA